MKNITHCPICDEQLIKNDYHYYCNSYYNSKLNHYLSWKYTIYSIIECGRFKVNDITYGFQSELPSINNLGRTKIFVQFEPVQNTINVNYIPIKFLINKLQINNNYLNIIAMLQ